MDANLAFQLFLALPLISAPLVYFLGRLVIRRKAEGKNNPARWLALLVLLGSIGMLFIATKAALSDTNVAVNFGTILMQLDGIGILLGFTALILGIVVVLFSGKYIEGESGEEKYYALLTALVGVIGGLGCTTDLFNLWVWFEAMAIATYMLVSFYRNQSMSLEAGVKYLVQSATGSMFVLFGIALVLFQTGSLEFNAIRVSGELSSPIILIAGAFFLIGFGVKVALVPMHTWLPDAHSKAPSGISIMLSGIVIEAGLVALLRALGALAPSSTLWGPILLGFGALNMLAGNLLALRQTEVKRLLAYSSIAQVGYMLVGFGVAVTFGLLDAGSSGFFHLASHALMKGLAFMAAGTLIYVLFLRHGSHAALTLDDLNGAARKYPFVVFVFSVALLALGGLPPFSGFMSKTAILIAAFETQNLSAMLLAGFAALNAILSLAYYAPLINRMYRLEPSESVARGEKVPWTMVLPMGLLAMGILVLGVWPSLISPLTGPAGQALLAAFGG